MSSAQHGTIISRPCILYLVCRESYGSTDGASNRDMEGALRAREEYDNILGNISGMQGTKYMQIRREKMLKARCIQMTFRMRVHFLFWGSQRCALAVP